MHAIRVHVRIAVEHVLAHTVGDGDHGVCALDRRSLAKQRQGVTTAQLLGFPGPERLEAVDGHDVRNRPHQLGQVTAEIRVPGVAVHDLGALDPRGHRQVDRHRLQRSGLRFGLRQRGPRLVCRDAWIFAGRPPAVDGHLGQPADLAGQILDGGAGSPVDVGRVLAGEDRDPGYGVT